MTSTFDSVTDKDNIFANFSLSVKKQYRLVELS